jgi:catechol 2,3-dioxygenase-like lactoylglutathione lyase family enzyme
VSLGEHAVNPQIAVSDIGRAQEFYEGILGLVPSGEQHAGTRKYACGYDTFLHLYEAPSHAGKATGTLAQWWVEKLDEAIATLDARGVSFELYGDPTPTDANGVHDSGYGRVAWFKDPDGNTFALEGPVNTD